MIAVETYRKTRDSKLRFWEYCNYSWAGLLCMMSFAFLLTLMSFLNNGFSRTAANPMYYEALGMGFALLLGIWICSCCSSCVSCAHTRVRKTPWILNGVLCGCLFMFVFLPMVVIGTTIRHFTSSSADDLVAICNLNVMNSTTLSHLRSPGKRASSKKINPRGIDSLTKTEIYFV